MKKKIKRENTGRISMSKEKKQRLKECQKEYQKKIIKKGILKKNLLSINHKTKKL